VAGQRFTARERSVGTALLDRVLGVAVRLPVRRVATANGVVIALLGVLGVLSIVSGSPFGIFDLDGERNVPATYTAALLFSVAVLALLVGRIDPAPGLPQLVGRGVGPLRLRLSRRVRRDSRAAGADHGDRLADPLLADRRPRPRPLALLARRLREIGAGFWLLVVGTACGIASQVAEAVEYGPGDKRVAAFDELMVFEELLEMVEALLIGLALLTALQALYRRARA
jgi:hypothetical protein